MNNGAVGERLKA